MFTKDRYRCQSKQWTVIKKVPSDENRRKFFIVASVTEEFPMLLLDLCVNMIFALKCIYIKFIYIYMYIYVYIYIYIYMLK